MTALKGECDMLYAVRKRRGHWTVCADDNVVLQFETYDEAVSTARGAVEVLASRARLRPAPRSSPCDGNAEHGGSDAVPPIASAAPHDDGARDDATAPGF
jgi:hypothetical protein